MSIDPTALMAKAQSVALKIMDKMDDKTTEFGIDSDLNLVPPGKGVFNITITPALIGTIGVVGLSLFVFWSLQGFLSQGGAGEGVGRVLRGVMSNPFSPEEW